MSVGPMGASIASSLSASNLAQRNSSDVSTAQQATSNYSRAIDSAEKAEKAAGVGESDESEKTSDRDADGRRAWERPQHEEKDSADEDISADATYDEGHEPDLNAPRGREIDLDG